MLSLPPSAEPSTQPDTQVSTTGEEEAPKTPAEAPDGDPTATPGEGSFVGVMEMTRTATTAPSEPETPQGAVDKTTWEDSSFRGGFSFAPRQFDQTTGSGMQPALSEEEAVAPTAPVGEPEETQPPTEHNGGEEKIQTHDGEVTTESKRS